MTGIPDCSRAQNALTVVVALPCVSGHAFTSRGPLKIVPEVDSSWRVMETGVVSAYAIFTPETKNPTTTSNAPIFFFILFTIFITPVKTITWLN